MLEWFWSLVKLCAFECPFNCLTKPCNLKFRKIVKIREGSGNFRFQRCKRLPWWSENFQEGTGQPSVADGFTQMEWGTYFNIKGESVSNGVYYMGESTKLGYIGGCALHTHPPQNLDMWDINYFNTGASETKFKILPS